jgi:DNA processing protein
MASAGALKPWLALSLTPGLNNEAARSLLIEFGSPAAVCAASRRSLQAVVSLDVAAEINRGVADDVIAPVLAWLDDRANHIVTLADADYPQALLSIPDPPLILYVKGRTDLLNRPSVAIVGSRSPTSEGIDNARAFAKSLSSAGFCIISGLSQGIDAAAHLGGLQGAGSSISVSATGLDRIYPASNHALAHSLSQRGALVSEFPLGTAPFADNFPKRNRLISGMSLGCLVVEASIRSGSLSTARLALEQGREVFAIPGSIHSPQSKGCHALLKQGAKLVETAQDILEELGEFPASAIGSPDASVQKADVA